MSVDPESRHGLRKRLLVFGLLAALCTLISVTSAFMRNAGDTTLPSVGVLVGMAVVFFLGSLWAFGIRYLLRPTGSGVLTHIADFALMVANQP